eukprot:c21940_g1_i1 orf=279-1190(-)
MRRAHFFMPVSRLIQDQNTEAILPAHTLPWPYLEYSVMISLVFDVRPYQPPCGHCSSLMEGCLLDSYNVLSLHESLGQLVEPGNYCSPSNETPFFLRVCSFSPVHTGGENDLRFIFCAVAICAMLDDWSGIELQQAMTYILNCQSYDGGFGLSPGLESHGGASYCAIAALKLMGHVLPDPVLGISISSILDVTAIIRWCVQRQSDCGGFQGRLNKPADACYAFWIGGLLQMLGAGHLYDSEALYSFQLSCQTKFGGFSKCPGDFPDLLHAYYGICSLSLLREPGLNPVWCELGITARTQGLST